VQEDRPQERERPDRVGRVQAAAAGPGGVALAEGVRRGAGGGVWSVVTYYFGVLSGEYSPGHFG